MRGLRHSIQHGDPYSWYKHSRVYPDWCADWFYDSEVVAVDNHLLLREHWATGVSQNQNMHYWFNKGFCPHEWLLGDVKDKSNRQINYAVRFYLGSGRAEYPGGYLFRTTRCKKCPTEIRAQIQSLKLFCGPGSKVMRKAQVVLPIARYIDLGPCTSPEDVHWKALTAWDRTRFRRLRMPVPPLESDESRKERPTLDVTHLEPIFSRFERSASTHTFPPLRLAE